MATTEVEEEEEEGTLRVTQGKLGAIKSYLNSTPTRPCRLRKSPPMPMFEPMFTRRLTLWPSAGQ